MLAHDGCLGWADILKQIRQVMKGLWADVAMKSTRNWLMIHSTQYSAPKTFRTARYKRNKNALL